jgi:hypothetical protein
VDEQALAGDDARGPLEHLERGCVVQHQADCGDGVDTVRHLNKVVGREADDFRVAAEDRYAFCLHLGDK